MLGLVWVVFMPFFVASVAQGELINAFAALICPAGGFALTWFLDRLILDISATLYADRIEFPEYGGKTRPLFWTDVRRVRWLSSPEGSLVFSLKSPEFPLGTATLGLEDLSLADQMTLIRYVRIAAKEIEQDRWGDFCRRVAIPLLEKLEDPEYQETDAGHESDGGFISSVLAGIRNALLAPYIMINLVTRSTWWTVAAIISLSAIINIRLLWGEWLQPFTFITLCVVGFFGLAGLVSSNKHQSIEDKKNRSVLPAIASFSLLLVGIPLLLNARALGWIDWPEWAGSVLAYGALFYAFSPIIWIILREKSDGLALEAEAIQRWEAFEAKLGNENEAAEA